MTPHWSKPLWLLSLIIGIKPPQLCLLLIPLLSHPDKWLATLAADDLRMIGPAAEQQFPRCLRRLRILTFSWRLRQLLLWAPLAAPMKMCCLP